MTMDVAPQNLLDDLARVHWDIALRTFGNSHATLIGLLVEWWIAGAVDSRWALEGGPSYGQSPQSAGERGQCDAILGAGDTSRGVVEVEGTRHAYTIEKLGKFFASQHPDLASLEFGIFLAYAYGPVGKGPARTISPLPTHELLAAARSVTAQHPGKQLVVLALDKAWEPQQTGPRARSEYYGGRPSRVRGWLVADGHVIAARQFVPVGPPAADLARTRLAPRYFTGCLLGGAVGDALGAPVEPLTLREIHARFGPAGIADYAPVYGRTGAITSNTQLALFTAEGIIRADNRIRVKGIGSPPSVVHNAYLRWLETQGEQPNYPFPEVRGGHLLAIPALHSRRSPGKATIAALRGWQLEGGDTSPNTSKGCGAVARIVPAGLEHHRYPPYAFELGRELAALTHGHPTGQLAAAFLAATVAAIIGGASLDAAIEGARRLLVSHPEHAECLRAIDAARHLALSADRSPGAVESLGRGWIAEEALAIGLYCALTADDFRGGVTLAVNHSGASASTGAITGGLLGALWGRDAIPAEWLAGLELRATIEEVAGDLFNHFGPDPGAVLGEGVDETPPDWDRYPGW